MLVLAFSIARSRVCCELVPVPKLDVLQPCGTHLSLLDLFGFSVS